MTSTISSKQFSYSGATREFCAFISDFGPNFRFKQVYDDAVDEGLSIVSQRTGHTVDFVVTNVIRDREGDVSGWKLEPTTKSIRQHPSARGVVAIVFND